MSEIEERETISYQNSLKFLHDLPKRPLYTNTLLDVIVITKQRRTSTYLIRTMGYLLSRIPEDAKVNVILFNNDRNSSFNNFLVNNKALHMLPIVNGRDYNLETRGNIINVMDEIFKIGSFDDWKGSNHRKWYRHEIFDYASVARYAYEKLSSDYLLVLQDDAIVSKDFYERIVESVKDLNVGDPNWYALKLFYPDIFDGWSLDDFGMMLLISTCLSAAITLGIRKVYGRKQWHNYLGILVYFILVIYSLLYLISKQALIPQRTTPELLKIPNSLSVLVGQVYPRRHLKAISDNLFFYSNQLDTNRMIKLKAVDMLLDDIANFNKWTQYLIVPNIVQHIGRYSSNYDRNQGDIREFPTSNSFPKGDEEF